MAGSVFTQAPDDVQHLNDPISGRSLTLVVLNIVKLDFERSLPTLVRGGPLFDASLGPVFLRWVRLTEEKLHDATGPA